MIAWRVATGALLAGVCACATHVPSAVTATPAAPATHILYVVRREWHIDVGFAVGELQEPLAPLTREFPGAGYVLFGFGDRHYLMARNRGIPELAAALWPGPGLILITSLTNSPAQAFGAGSVIELRMTQGQIRAVQDFIAHSIARDAAGGFESDGSGPYPGSLYLSAVPRYSGLHTCITWAAEALRAGDIPVRSGLTLVAAQLWRQLRKIQGETMRVPSIAGRRVAVLAHHGRTTALGNDHGGLRGRWRATAADAAGQEPGGEYRAD